MYVYDNKISDDERFLVDSYLKTYFEMLIDAIGDQKELGASYSDQIAPLFPSWKVELAPEDCVHHCQEILRYLTDTYLHKVDVLTEYVLQRAFEALDEEKDYYGKDFYPGFYPGTPRKALAQKARLILENGDTDGAFAKYTDKQILDFYIDSDSFIETCFLDSDCLFIESELAHPNIRKILTKQRDLRFIPKEFAPLLPPDIAKEVLASDDTLARFLSNFRDLIENSTYRLKDMADFKEKDFQLLFELYGKGFQHLGFEPNGFFREEDVGNGNIDFVLELPNNQSAVFELKMEEKSRVIASLSKQIPEYMKRSGSATGVCVIFSKGRSAHDREYQKVADSHSTDTQEIHAFLIDYSKKRSPSQS